MRVFKITYWTGTVTHVRAENGREAYNVAYNKPVGDTEPDWSAFYWNVSGQGDVPKNVVGYVTNRDGSLCATVTDATDERGPENA